jgi:hypothetical protein
MINIVSKLINSTHNRQMILAFYCVMRSFIAPSIIKMIKSRRMKWAGHVARMGEKMNAYRILV